MWSVEEPGRWNRASENRQFSTPLRKGCSPSLPGLGCLPGWAPQVEILTVKWESPVAWCLEQEVRSPRPSFAGCFSRQSWPWWGSRASPSGLTLWECVPCPRHLLGHALCSSAVAPFPPHWACLAPFTLHLGESAWLCPGFSLSVSWLRTPRGGGGAALPVPLTRPCIKASPRVCRVARLAPGLERPLGGV